MIIAASGTTSSSVIDADNRLRVRKPCAIVVPNGPASARTRSTWIHCSSSVAVEKPSMRACVMSNQRLTPRSVPTDATSCGNRIVVICSRPYVA